MLKRKVFLGSLLTVIIASTNLLAVDVLVAKKKVRLNGKIETTNLRLKKVKRVRKTCIPITVNGLGQDHYIATHYINPGSIICEKDIKMYEKKSVVFNFGNIEIEKEGKVVGETKKYIKIKKPNGRIEKIFKDGSLK